MRTWSPQQIIDRRKYTYPFDGEWAKIFGEPDVRFSSLIRGRAKSGKSTFCVKFAQYISQFGRVLYVSAEEGVRSTTVADRLKAFDITSTNIRFCDARNIEEIDKKLQTGGFRFIIIDSVQHVEMTVKDWIELKLKYKKRKLSWHLVMQMGQNITKFQHEVDVLIEISDGIAYVNGRNTSAAQMTVLSQKRIPTLFD